MENIGLVIYEKNEVTGDLTAKWEHSDYGRGTGIAKAIKTDEFEGTYIISYYDEKGKPQAERDLAIKKNKNFYEVYWSKNGIRTAEGIGFIYEHGLCVGYHDI